MEHRVNHALTSEDVDAAIKAASKSEAKRLAYQQRPPYYTSSSLKELVLTIAAELDAENRLTDRTEMRLRQVAQDLREQG